MKPDELRCCVSIINTVTYSVICNLMNCIKIGIVFPPRVLGEKSN